MYCDSMTLADLCQAPFADQRDLKMAENHMAIGRKRYHLEMGVPSKDHFWNV